MKICHSKKLKNRVKLESGQAIVEYILILVVSLTLVLSLASVIFTPFSIFLNQFLGEYVSCLLDSGDLPTLDSDSKQGPPSCPMPGFSGGAPVSIKGYSSGGGGSSGSGGSSGGGNSSSSNSGSSSDQAKNSGEGDGSSGDGRGRDSKSRSSSGGGAGEINRSTAGDGSASISSSKTIELSGSEQRAPQDFFKGNRFANTPLGLNQKKTRAIGLDGLMEQERKKLLISERGTQRRLEVSSEFSTKSKKTEIKPPERKDASVSEEEEQGFQFGKIIRILFIIAIIIIIIALIGGQVAQMMKSWEK